VKNKNLGAYFLLTWVTSISKPIFDEAKSYAKPIIGEDRMANFARPFESMGRHRCHFSPS
jgi:hypothetical protein